jgi:hypothetical protein
MDAQQALADALLVLEGWARTTNPTPVHLRVADHGSHTYIDMGDADEKAIRIGPDGWSLVDAAPVLFYRTRLTGALPEPVRGGSLDSLWGIVNIAEEDRPLVLAWLVHALISPDTPHPILSLFAEQGSGKSSGTKVLVSLVDPSPVPLRKPPKDADGWVTAASGSWVVGLDNMSTMPAWLSDSMCRAVTGDGDVRRALYTDGELAVFAFRRCLVVNGIDIGAMRGDYAERSLVAHLRRIPPARRRTENALAEQWRRAYPGVLGVLLDLAAGVKRARPGIRLESSPRMADFAHTLAAVDLVLGTDGFKNYLDQAQDLAVDSLESEPFIVELQQRITVTFTGTAAELLSKATPPVDGWKRPQDWPKDARAVTGMLRRTAPALRSAGWTVEETPAASRSRSLTWTVTPPASERGEETVPAVPSSSLLQVNGTNSGGERGGEAVGSDESSPPAGDGGEAPHLFPSTVPTTSAPSEQVKRGSGERGEEIPSSRARDTNVVSLVDRTTRPEDQPHCPVCGQPHADPALDAMTLCSRCRDAGNYLAVCAVCARGLPREFKYDRHHACRKENAAS